MLKRAVEKAGFQAHTAQNGLDATALLRQLAFNLVITDLVMPEQEGIETIRLIKRDFPHIKIIAISGGGRNAPDGYLQVAKALGADRTFAKPFDAKGLISAVTELLE